MKKFLGIIVMILMISPSVWASGPISATTEDGKAVILSPDGTWQFAQQAEESGPSSLSIPAASTAVLKSKKKFYELWYDPNTWSETSNDGNPDAEFMLNHKTGDAYAMLIGERIAMPLNSLLDVAVDNVRNAGSDVRVVFKNQVKVNGVDFTNMRLDFTINKIPFTYYGYYWTGKAGALQAIAFTGQQLFPEFEDDFRELLSGIVVK